MTLDVAGERVEEIQAALTAVQPEASISAGLAELVDDDNLESVILRADNALYNNQEQAADLITNRTIC